jgi:hypothetical protein
VALAVVATERHRAGQAVALTTSNRRWVAPARCLDRAHPAQLDSRRVETLEEPDAISEENRGEVDLHLVQQSCLPAMLRA